MPKTPPPRPQIPLIIAEELGRQIVSGRYPPHAALDGEVASSGQRLVSRGAYREAVRILSAKGLVSARPRVGTRVNPYCEWRLLDPDLLTWILRTKSRPGLVDALFELRAVIEPEAAALAAPRRTQQHLDAIGQALAVMRSSTAIAGAWRRGAQDFHVAILQASGNPFLKTLTHGISTAVGATIKQHRQPLRDNPLREHERVYDCIADMDAESAREAMLDLLELAALDAQS